MKPNEPREYKQKFFAGERVFVYLAIAFGAALAIQLFFGDINWIDVGLFAIYLAVMGGLTAYSAYYPDVLVGADGFAYRIFIRYKKVTWNAVREVAAYPEDSPTGVMLAVGEERPRKLLLRRSAVNGFDDMLNDLARYVPSERWTGFEFDEREEEYR
jgi:hypothetical protein